MASNDRGVPRGDHAGSEGDKQDSIRRQDANTNGEGVAADAASSGADSPPTAEPDRTKGSDRGGTAGWGGEPSGGSVFDKRGPDR